jgi:hypothetical protein
LVGEVAPETEKMCIEFETAGTLDQKRRGILE